MEIKNMLPVSDEVYHARLQVCLDCPLANKIAGGLVIQCSVCKCEMHLKARLARKKEGCPHPDGPKWKE